MLLALGLATPLLPQSADAAASASAPDPAAQDKLLELMHGYAAHYISNLPDFICSQITRQSESGVKSNHWHKGETLTAKLSFSQGRELRAVESVNGKPVRAGQVRAHSALTTEGEFGILLSRVLGPESEAYFTWSRWETVRGKTLAVFDYSVDKEHSSMSLTLSDLAKAIVPYHGSVYADPSTGAVWRISDAASDIPAKLLTRAISTTIDYDEIPIAGKQYLLPVEAVVSLTLESKKIRHQIEFQDYRKFEADSSITFGSEAKPGPPR